jgi:hypothetical protein
MLALASVFFGAAQAAEGDELSVSLLTFSPGEIYWQRFGHNALLVRNAIDGTATVYNYGMFDFKQEHFFLNFARGRMQYHLSALSLADTLYIYDYEGRGIVEQELNLLPSQRAKLDAFLRWNALPENAPYRYDYFLANCSTRLRDAIDQVLDGDLKRQLEAQPTPATFRSEAVRLVSPDLAFALGMDFGLGPAADRPINAWERSYVPEALMEAVRTARVKGTQPLVLEERELLPSRVPEAPAQLPSWWLPMLLTGLAWAALIVALSFLRPQAPSAIVTSVTALVFGLAGLVSACIWGLTEHWSGARCANLLQFSPLCLLLVRSSRWHRPLTLLLAFLGVAGLVLSFFTVTAASRHWIGLSLPVLLTLAFVTLRARRPT